MKTTLKSLNNTFSTNATVRHLILAATCLLLILVGVSARNLANDILWALDRTSAGYVMPR